MWKEEGKGVKFFLHYAGKDAGWRVFNHKKGGRRGRLF
jgi:hypothetical protein